MKKLLILFILSISSLYGKAQVSEDPTITKFVNLYKINNVDSIYQMFSPQMKSALNLSGTKQIISTLKNQLGNVTNTKRITNEGIKSEEFRLSFEKPIVEISIMIQDKMISGIRQIQLDKGKKDTSQLRDEDNFFVENSIGKLYGTLAVPQKTGKMPVVLLISGSGPTDRNMNQGLSLQTNSFQMLAKGLSSMGIATLRYDKRGVGKSKSALKSNDIIFDDFINDANLFIHKLKDDPRFSRVIVLGHSEGASIGIAASLETQPDAYISLCGYASDLTTLLRNQLKSAVSENDFQIANILLDSLQASKPFKKDLPPSLAGIFTPNVQKFIISSVRYNSVKEIAKLNIPILIVGGTTDLQIPKDDSRKLAAANIKAHFKLLQGMNHVLKMAPIDKVTNMQTYGDKNLPIDEELISTIVTFVNTLK